MPSANQPGATDLVVEITRKTFSGALGFNNRLTKLLGTYRGEVYGEANNLLGMQEKSYARVLQSFEDKMTVLSLGEDLPLFGEGTRMSFMLNQVWSNTPLFDIASGLTSKQLSFNVGLTHPLIRSRSTNLSLRGTFSMVDSRSRSQFFNEEISNDRIRSFRIGMTYDLADGWRGINIADLELSQGIDALGARNPSQAARDAGTSKLSAAQGQVDYVKTNLYLARLQPLAPQWDFLVAFQGQYTEDVLLAPEQFSLGGEQFLRAYDPSEFIGDKGYATKAELRYTINPFDIGSTTFYGFYDHGEVHYNYDRPSVSVDAAGLGMRLSVTQYFSGYIEGAQPLHPEQSIKQNKDMRLFGGVKLTY
ncbi:MAG: ShlB/FhaC/HecB family hemolysin secretion/activation protein [Methylomonas sp.]|nr:ShlB/FhaC/HecB family hemolysin secretion/activation protein [Methylomonas sp.]